MNLKNKSEAQLLYLDIYLYYLLNDNNTHITFVSCRYKIILN